MRRIKFINPRLTYIYVPQTLPVLQLVSDVLAKESAFLPENLEAKVDIFLVTSVLLQAGQAISYTLLGVNTSFSNGLPQVLQTNS